ncbi:MAG: right-handed parallel beta-helix repeat-containing protein [Candidatus Korarchaeum sp.]|nr:right-handed parallel beta-helix repeat-containing protein [Candidatus Korarchaeum sp.]
MNLRLALAVLVLLAIVPNCIEVNAVTYTVTTLDDHDDGTCDSDCTLREAINKAQADCWDAIDLINFDPSLSGTIYLKSLLPSLTCPMVVDGDRRITLSGGGTLSYGLVIYAWDGSIDPDITIRGLFFEGFGSAGIIVHPSGQVLMEGVEVKGSRVGVTIYSTSASAKVTLRELSVHDNLEQGIYVTAPHTPGEAEIRVERSYIYANYHGIWIDGVNEVRNVTIGDPSDSRSGNYVYGNEAEGILLSGDVRRAVVTHNLVGTDGSSPRPNLMGGIVLTNGVKESEILNNEVAYNSYQNILITGKGTEGNLVEGNYVYCDPTLKDPLC